MQEMITKSVDVLGDAIMATKDADGIIWSGVSFFCKALGMNKKQKDYQIEKIGKDETLKRGCRKFPAGVFDPVNEAVGMRIDFIPLWLAKINITKTMLTEHPDLADKLLDYQLKVKDILAEAFLPKQEPPTSVAGQIQLLAQGNVELNKRVDEVQNKTDKLTERFDKFEKELPLMPNEADLLRETVNKRVMNILGGKESGAYKSRSIVNTIFGDAYRNLKRNFDVRKYNCIKRSQIEVAIRIAEEYVPPVYLAERIEQANAGKKGGE